MALNVLASAGASCVLVQYSNRLAQAPTPVHAPTPAAMSRERVDCAAPATEPWRSSGDNRGSHHCDSGARGHVVAFASVPHEPGTRWPSSRRRIPTGERRRPIRDWHRVFADIRVGVPLVLVGVISNLAEGGQTTKPRPPPTRLRATLSGRRPIHRPNRRPRPDEGLHPVRGRTDARGGFIHVVRSPV